MIPALAHPHGLSGSPMIESIDIRNYKCFEHLHVTNCRRVNVIVGDNGTGKTALLEAIFMALGNTSEFVIRFRQYRGLDGAFRGPPRKIEESIWRDYFYNLDLSQSISVTLNGTGPEARSVWIDRGEGATLIPLNAELPASANSGIQFHWKDHAGVVRSAGPEISTAGFKFPDTGEDLPDFFFFASNQTFSSSDNADRFSTLSREKKKEFIKFFSDEYNNWIEDLSIESRVGAPAIYATLNGLSDQIPITSVSGGINKVITILLAIASREQSVVLIDEAENGLFHTHHKAYWKIILRFARDYKSQMFVTTHSDEWLEALALVMESKLDDVALWRVERGNGPPVIRQFTGKQVPAGIRSGEVR
jgi:ABC-type lipoprotein export system ATPase subunit